jgi:hypothetical protein
LPNADIYLYGLTDAHLASVFCIFPERSIDLTKQRVPDARTTTSGEVEFSSFRPDASTVQGVLMKKRNELIGWCSTGICEPASFNVLTHTIHHSYWNYARILFGGLPLFPMHYSYDITFDTSSFQGDRDIPPSAGTDQPPKQQETDAVTNRLRELDRLKAAGAITEEEYTEQRKRLLNSL